MTSREYLVQLATRRRETFVLSILIVAVLLLVWNSSAFFHDLQLANSLLSREIQIASTAITLNVALILFGWRYYVDIQQDYERQEDQERRVAVLASTDPVTGLLNRKGFSDRAEEVGKEAADTGQRLAIVSYILHRFKSVNEQHGFEIGDCLLKRVGELMLETFGEDVCIARVSGDEIAVAMPIAEGDVGTIDQLTDDGLRAITRPFVFDERIIQIGAYAGIAVAAPETRIPDLLRRADIAMDRALSGRIARPVWFDAGMERALIAQSEIEQGIRFGLEHGQFEPFFEPQVDLSTGEIVGFEVLARWNHPLSGQILPDVFIPVAEETGLISRLSELVIGQALEAASKWETGTSISVNISPSQLTDGWLAHRIVKMLSESGFPAERLVVEITESSLFADIDFARSVATSLKNQGIRLALDDFGTGYSSLSHLRSLPFDIIKIDRSFVSTLSEKKESAAIVKAVTTLANTLGVPVCIEGIESESAYNAVLDFGCAVGQGWYLGKAMPADAAREMLGAGLRAADVGDFDHPLRVAE